MGNKRLPSTFLIPRDCSHMTGQGSPAAGGGLLGGVRGDVKSELLSWLWEPVTARGQGVESALLASSCPFWPHSLPQTRFL